MEIAIYAALVAVAAFLGSGLTEQARRIALRRGWIDRPDGLRKQHPQPTPLLGGGALCAALGLLLLPLLAAGAWGLGPAARSPETVPLLAGLLLSGSAYFLVGLCDDLWGLRPFDKLLGQAAAALPYLLCGRAIDSVQLLGGGWETGPLGLLLTLAWLLLCVNALNLLDGHDGVAATVGLVLCVVTAVLAHMQQNGAVAIIALAAAGVLAGFLRYNWPPARIFLGDAGSLPLGFLVGALAMEATLKRAAGLSLAVPLLLMLIPSFDTCMAVVRRLLRGRPVAQGDREHLHHLLARRGLAGWQVPAAVGALCLATGLAVVIGQWWGSDLLAASLAGAVVTGLVAARVFGHGELLLLLGRLRFAERQVNPEAAGTEPLAEDPQLIWRRLCTMFEQQGGVRLELTVLRDGDPRPEFERRWLAPGTASAVKRQRDWEATLHRGGCELRVEAAWRRRAMRPGTPSDDRHHLLLSALRHWPLADAPLPAQPRRAA